MLIKQLQNADSWTYYMKLFRQYGMNSEIYLFVSVTSVWKQIM